MVLEGDWVTNLWYGLATVVFIIIGGVAAAVARRRYNLETLTLVVSKQAEVLERLRMKETDLM
eukprot:771911-Prorocentrum_minimum.AAC.1